MNTDIVIYPYTIPPQNVIASFQNIFNNTTFFTSISDFLNSDKIIGNNIILITLGIEPEELNIIKYNKLLKTSYINQFVGLEYINQISSMSQLQKKEYEERLKLPNNYKKQLKLLQVANLVQPQNINIDNLNLYSPKLKQLLTIVINNFDKHHLIYSQFKDYGITTISKLLDLLDISNLTITGSDKKEKRIEKIKLFNNGNISVLLTNINLGASRTNFVGLVGETSRTNFVGLKNIDYIHFVEGHNISIYKSFLEYIYKRINYDRSQNLKIVNYVSDNNEIDVLYYKKFIEYLIKVNGFYEKILKNAIPININ
jgi:hypothetical protein